MAFMDQAGLDQTKQKVMGSTASIWHMLGSGESHTVPVILPGALAAPASLFQLQSSNLSPSSSVLYHCVAFVELGTLLGTLVRLPGSHGSHRGQYSVHSNRPRCECSGGDPRHLTKRD